MKAVRFFTIFLALCLLGIFPVSATGAPDMASGSPDSQPAVVQSSNIIVNHANWDWYNSQPQAVVDSVAAQKIFFAHASVGSNIVDGLADLQTADATRYPLTPVSAGASPPATTVNGAFYEYARGNPDWSEKVSDFEDYVANGWQDDQVDLVMNKFCFIDQAADWTVYRDSMLGLEAAYPHTKFIYWSMPLTTGSDADEVLRANFNQHLREWIATQDNKLFFDLADIEAWSPAGVHQLFSYNSAAYERLYTGYSSDGGHLNSSGASRAASGLYSLFGQAADSKLATTTSLVSDLNPANYGQEVTFQATVSAVSTETSAAVVALLPSGTLTFRDETSILGTVTLDAEGQAEWSTAALAAGSHHIRAQYSGNAVYAASSDALTQEVAALPTYPEIRVEGNSIEIPCADSTPQVSDNTDLGSALIAGGRVDKSFIIRNTGDDELVLTGTPAVTLNAVTEASLNSLTMADFSILRQPASPIAPGGSATLTVRFAPATAGLRTAVISIANNDSDENPYTFNIQGLGLAPELNLNSPNGGENWTIGSNQNITWTTRGVTGGIKIQISRNGGSAWSTLVSSTANDGLYTWKVSGQETARALIKISSVAKPTLGDISEATFRIAAPPPPVISVTAPAGGENWTIGANQNITWTTHGMSGPIKIQISRNGGASWATLVSSTPNDGLYNWKVSGKATTQALIKISSTSKSGVYDISDGLFTIAAAPPPVILVVAPNGGQNWTTASTQDITWTSSRVNGPVRIQISYNGGGAWTTLTASTPNDGLYSWKVASRTSTRVVIKISAVSSTPVFDISDGLFTISSP